MKLLQWDGMEGGVMQDMVGSWKLEKRDPNFGDFLVCREVGWFLRQLMCNSTVDTEYRLSPDRSTLTKITSNWKGSSEYPMPTEGEFCPLKTLSGKPEVGRLFETSGGNLVQVLVCAVSATIARTGSRCRYLCEE